MSIPAVAVVGALLVAAAGAESPSIEVSDTTPAAGAVVVVEVHGFVAPATSVVVTLGGTEIAEITLTSTGDATVPVAIPSEARGTVRLAAIGETADGAPTARADAVLTVGSAQQRGMALTGPGSADAALTAVGVALVAAGMALLAAARRPPSTARLPSAMPSWRWADDEILPNRRRRPVTDSMGSHSGPTTRRSKG